MNGRIKELAEESKNYAMAQLDNTGELHRYYDIYFEKFAESIIQDCIQVIHKQERIPEGFLYAKDAHTHKLAIKQHFGIDNE